MPRFFVDNCTHLWRGRHWAHFGTDGTEEELLAFALSIGLRASWLQRSGTPYVHFDITPPKRAEAIAKGALPVTAREFHSYVIAPKLEAARQAQREAVAVLSEPHAPFATNET